MSTSLRKYLLSGLRLIGVKSFRAQSGQGFPFVCHVGDFASEVPFYNRAHCRAELELMAKWCARCRETLVFDVGANVGFIATQLVQAAPSCRVVAFEPVFSTFAKLVASIRKLHFSSRIQTVCCAVSDRGGSINPVRYDERESLFAQVDQGYCSSQASEHVVWCPEVTLDCLVAKFGQPKLIKIDVEGYEAHVLRGARAILHGAEPPAICFELNPLTLRQVGSSVEAIAAELNAYRFYYVDDFEGQRRAPGAEIEDLASLSWCCNLFAAHESIPPDDVKMLFC